MAILQLHLLNNGKNLDIIVLNFVFIMQFSQIIIVLKIMVLYLFYGYHVILRRNYHLYLKIIHTTSDNVPRKDWSNGTNEES